MDTQSELTSKLRHSPMWRTMARAVGLDLYAHAEDRRVLETIILPDLAARADVRRALFVGCDWYTRRYAVLFGRQELWTIDVDPAKSRYGAARHITDCVSNVDRHFGRASFDLVVCNGVFGWGLDQRETVERMFWALRRVMRRGALFVLGWNDVPRRTPFPLHECHSLGHFHRHTFPRLSTWRYLTATPYRHTYDFYTR